MDKPNQKDEERFNKAVQMYVKKYQLNVYSLIKFIEEKIAVTPQTKNIIVTEILKTKSHQQPISKDMLKMYLHMVAAAQARIDIRGKKMESFNQFYRLTFYESKPKDEGKVPESKGQKPQLKKREEDRFQVKKQADYKNQNIKTEKTSSQESNKTNRPNQSSEDTNKQAFNKNRSSPRKQQQLQVIEQDVIDQNRVSGVVYRRQNTQQLLLKMPQAQMMTLKSEKSVQITGYDKVGQNYFNPIIKFRIIFGEHSVYRRYSEFQRLMNDLSKRYEGFPLPQLPPKEGIKSSLSYFWGVDEAFLNDRQVRLQEMLNCLLSSKFVNKDQILQKFLSDKDFEIQSSDEGAWMSYLKSITSISTNTKLWKIYGVAFYKYLLQFKKAQINTTVTAKYKQVESLLNFCVLIDTYRNSINGNFQRRRDIFKQLKVDKNDRNLTITKFDKLSAISASQIRNLSKEIDKYIELKSQESWLSYLIREKESEAEIDIEQLKKEREEIGNRINVMQVNLLTSIQQLRKQKISYLESVGDKMIQWRKSIHP